jgi:hypothetical protein
MCQGLAVVPDDVRVDRIAGEQCVEPVRDLRFPAGRRGLENEPQFRAQQPQRLQFGWGDPAAQVGAVGDQATGRS